MAAAKEIKNRCLNDIRKKNSKVVCRQMDLPNKVRKGKNKLIEELMYNERKTLKFSESEANSGSDDESNKKITTLLQKEKDIIFDETKIKIEELDIQMRQEREKQKVIFPIIPKHKMDQMFSLLKSNKNVSVYEKKLNKCLSHIHTSAKPPWNSPSVILKAMKDSLLQRKWNNLTQLLVMLIHLPSAKYKPIIRHVSLSYLSNNSLLKQIHINSILLLQVH